MKTRRTFLKWLGILAATPLIPSANANTSGKRPGESHDEWLKRNGILPTLTGKAMWKVELGEPDVFGIGMISYALTGFWYFPDLTPERAIALLEKTEKSRFPEHVKRNREVSIHRSVGSNGGGVVFFKITASETKRTHDRLKYAADSVRGDSTITITQIK